MWSYVNCFVKRTVFLKLPRIESHLSLRRRHSIHKFTKSNLQRHTRARVAPTSPCTNEIARSK